MTRKARFCKRCGQAFHGHGLWGLCPGCRAEKRRDGRMMRDHEPGSGFNLPAGCYGVPEPDERACETCRHCIEECCDMGLCELKLMSDPESYGSWRDAMDYVETARVDMQRDACARWEEC